MIVTVKNTNKQYSITLRAWDGTQWLPDCAGDVLDTWSAGLYEPVQADIKCLQEEINNFNVGADLEWLTHSPACQQALLTIEEVADNG